MDFPKTMIRIAKRARLAITHSNQHGIENAHKKSTGRTSNGSPQTDGSLLDNTPRPTAGHGCNLHITDAAGHTNRLPHDKWLRKHDVINGC
jgi:hypothetical protein